MYLQRDEMMFLELKLILKMCYDLWLQNILQLKCQEMLRNDWLACMMARMIISASSFASAWKVINYHTHTFFEIQQVFIFICYSLTNKFALLPVGQG